MMCCLINKSVQLEMEVTYVVTVRSVTGDCDQHPGTPGAADIGLWATCCPAHDGHSVLSELKLVSQTVSGEFSSCLLILISLYHRKSLNINIDIST